MPWHLPGRQQPQPEEVANGQDQATWEAEATVIAETRRSIVWRSPSRHDGPAGEEPGLSDEGVFVGEGAYSESIPAETQRDDERITIKGGRERGLVIHKLLEEVLTGETKESADTLETRARTLLSELGVAEADRAEDGPHAPELAASVRRALAIPEVVALRPRLLPEMTVFSAEPAEQGTIYIGGIADALALDGGKQCRCGRRLEERCGTDHGSGRPISGASARLSCCNGREGGSAGVRNERQS